MIILNSLAIPNLRFFLRSSILGGSENISNYDPICFGLYGSTETALLDRNFWNTTSDCMIYHKTNNLLLKYS